MWGCRYFADDLVDPISITAGLVQTGLYLDFFYVYFTKYVVCADLAFLLFPLQTRCLTSSLSTPRPFTGFFRARSSNCQHDVHHMIFFPHSAGFVPCAVRKAILELTPVSIVIRPYTRICICTKHLGILNMQGGNFAKRSLFDYIGARDIPALELYTIRLKVPSTPGMLSTAGSIIYCPARSATCAVAAPDRALVNAPDEAIGTPPATGNNSTRTNAGA